MSDLLSRVVLPLFLAVTACSSAIAGAPEGGTTADSASAGSDAAGGDDATPEASTPDGGDATTVTDAGADSAADGPFRDAPGDAPGDVGADAPVVDSAPPPACTPPSVPEGGAAPHDLLATVTGMVMDVALADGGVYFVTGGAFASTGAVGRVADDGGAPSVLATMDAGASTLRIADGHAYYVATDPNGAGGVTRVAVSGGAPELLLPLVNGYDVTIHGDVAYATEYFPNPGAVLAAALDGGPGPTFSTASSLSNSGITADSDGVFWVSTNYDGAGSENNGAVYSAPLDGGSSATIAQHQTQPAFVALDATYVYWTTQGDGMGIPGTVMRMPKQGGNPVALAVMCDNSQPTALVVDGGEVFFTVLGLGGPSSVQRVSTSGGTPLIVAQGGQPFGIAVDAAFVYVADGAGSVYRVPRS